MPKRQYNGRTKLAAVMAAEISGVVQAAEQTGIPHQTISYWMEDPRFGEIRRKTREDLADEVKVAAHLAWKRVIESMPTMEPRDAIFAAEKATTLQLLLNGDATSRTETRDITGTIPDGDIAAAIREAEHLLGAGAGRAPAQTADPPAG